MPAARVSAETRARAGVGWVGLFGALFARVRIQPLEFVRVDSPHRPRREHPLKEAADSPGAVPGRGDLCERGAFSRGDCGALYMAFPRRRLVRNFTSRFRGNARSCRRPDGREMPLLLLATPYGVDPAIGASATGFRRTPAPCAIAWNVSATCCHAAGCGVTPVTVAGWLPHALTGHDGRDGNDSATPDGHMETRSSIPGGGPYDRHIGADQRLAA